MPAGESCAIDGQSMGSGGREYFIPEDHWHCASCEQQHKSCPICSGKGRVKVKIKAAKKIDDTHCGKCGRWLSEPGVKHGDQIWCREVCDPKKKSKSDGSKNTGERSNEALGKSLTSGFGVGQKPHKSWIGEEYHG